jgi:hypothetical protein
MKTSHEELFRMKNIAKYIQNFTMSAALGGRFGDGEGGGIFL